MSGLEEEPINVVYQEACSRSRSVEVTTITEQDNEVVSKKVSRFTSDIADAVLKVSKQEDGPIALQLADMLTNTQPS